MTDKKQKLIENFNEALDNASRLVDAAANAGREMTADEVKDYDKHMGDAERLKETMNRVDQTTKLAVDAARPMPRKADQIQPSEFDTGLTENNLKTFGRMRAFKGQSEFEAKKKAYRAGRWLQAQFHGDESAVKFCKDAGLPLNVMTGSTGASGGFIVPEEMSSTIIDNREQYGVARRLCKIEPMSSDTKSVPVRASGVTAYFVGAGDDITLSDKSWANANLVANKLAALTRFSSELAEDAAISVADDLADEIAYAFAVKEDDCFFNGTGASTYGGIIGVRTKLIDGNHAAGAVDAASGNDTFAELTIADIVKMMAALPAYAKMRAKFTMSSAAHSQTIARLVAAGGGNTIETLAGVVAPRFLGYDIELSESMPNGIGTDYSDVAMMLFGDFARAAMLGDRRSITMALSTERYFESDDLAIKGTERIDINVHSLGDGTTAGPVVGLIGE